MLFFFFKQKTAYELRISDWSSDVCSSDLQLALRETEGTTILIYDQTCAAENRRRRKRGKLEAPAQRYYIAPAVCEGCGDCSVQSTCVSIQPLATPDRKSVV